jgi:mannan endo-1,4-beta-mannosidase
MLKRLKLSTTAMTVLAGIAVSLMSFVLYAPPAQAVTAFKLSTTAQVWTSAGIAYKTSFSVKSTRKATVTLTLYRGTTAIRKLSATRQGTSYVYAKSWNLRDSSGKLVGAGVYGYRITAVSGSSTTHASGHVTLLGTAAPTLTSQPAAAAVKRWVGFYVSGNMSTTTGLDAIESSVGRKADVVNMFVADSESFPTNRCTTLAGRGATPMVTLEFKSLSSGGLAAITNGSHDAYLRSFADAAKSYGGQVWLRPFHEMNGNWYPWGATGSNTPAQLVAAWKHVHDIFVAEGATNVKFVWCVNSESVPNTSANAIGKYWPGPAYVDYMAIDAYNFGTNTSGGTWRSFSSVVGAAYAKLISLSMKPVILAETGSAEQGGSKAAWVTAQFSAIKSTYPRITGVCWFNCVSGEDWRVDTSANSLSAFKTAVANF